MPKSHCTRAEHMRDEGLKLIKRGHYLKDQGKRILNPGKKMYAEGTELRKTDKAAGNELRRKARAWIDEGKRFIAEGKATQTHGEKVYNGAAEALGLWKEEI